MRRLIHLIWPVLFACEEIIDYPESNEESEFIIVDGIITNENKRQEIRLTRPGAGMNEEVIGITNAVVAINDGDSTRFLRNDPRRPGYYVSRPFRAVFGKVYTLGIFIDDIEYYAQATAVFGEPLKPIQFEEIEENRYRFMPVSSDAPSMQEVQISWQEENLENLLSGTYYTLNVVDINRIFAPPKQEFEFPAGARIIRRQFSLSPKHQEFLRSLLSETDWRGGYFDLAPGNVKTNLSAGALGFFGVSMVTSDTILID